MPEPLHPPYVAGAVQQFRTLNRWLDINAQNGPLSRTQTFITLPSFSQAVSWQRYSDIVAAFNYEGPNNFSLKSGSNLPSNPNYCLCIMWKDINEVVHRYAIWKDDGESVYCTYPLYTGQLIKKNFRFEVWSTNNTPAIQLLPITFYTSVLGNVDYRYGADSSLVKNDAEVTNFSATSTPITLDLTYVRHRFNGSTLTLSPNAGWTDIITSQNAGQAGPPIPVVFQRGTDTNGFYYGELDGASYLSFDASYDISYGTVAILFQLTSLAASGVLYKNGAGIDISYNTSANRFTCLSATGVGNVNAKINTWYLIIFNSSTCYVYQMNVGLIDTFAGSVTYAPDETLTFGIIQCNLAELIVYGDTGFWANKQNIYDYFNTSLFKGFSVPLTFPSNSTPQPN